MSDDATNLSSGGHCQRCGAPLTPGLRGSACGACMLEVFDDPELMPSSEDAAEGADFTAPLLFGDYVLEQERGHGGMGVVYRARQRSLDRVVALKLLLLGKYSSAESIARFQREARLAAKLNHPNIVPIYEVGEHEGHFYFTMEFVEGRNLEEIAASGPLPPRRAVECVLQIAEAVQAAHEQGLLHRDLKPSNVIVDCFGTCRLTDFGLAKRIGERSDLTQAGRVMGTPNYLAPEAVSGPLTEVGVSSDVYGIGAIFYELLTGRPPFTGNSVLEMLHSIRHDEPGSLRALNPSVPRDYETVCLKCLAKEPSARYASASGLRDDCKRLLSGHAPLARRPGPIVIAQKWAQRNIGPVLVGSGILIVGSLGYATLREMRAERDLSRQVARVSEAWGKAELASRSGRWRDAIAYWEEAEAAGYGDAIGLGLRRAEAWTVIGQPDRAGAELTRLSKRNDLGDRRGAVLLYLGEHELFGKGTFEQGVNRIKEAAGTGLAGAEKSYAEALLAESTPKALELFRQTLKWNPLHHGAHRHGLGLEHLLGRHQDLAEHIRVFKTLFPEDPSATFIEVSELALGGKLEEAQVLLESLKDRTDGEILQRMRSGLRLLSLAARHYDVEAFLGAKPNERVEWDRLVEEARGAFSSAGARGGSSPLSKFRVPELPCIREGIHEGFAAVQMLMVPWWGDIESTLRKIKSSWGRHPEALLPMFAGSSLDARHPREGAKSLALLSNQSELFQMAADSPSVVPNLERLAVYRAARVQFELAGREQPAATNRANSTDAARACLENIRKASRLSPLSAAEGRAYFEMAFALNDYDLAREVLKPWEQHKPEDLEVLRARIQLASATGTFGEALRSIDQLLTMSPTNEWALEQKKLISERLKELVGAFPPAAKTEP